MEDGLQGVRFFEFLTEEEREEFAEAAEPVSFGPGGGHHRGGCGAGEFVRARLGVGGGLEEPFRGRQQASGRDRRLARAHRRGGEGATRGEWGVRYRQGRGQGRGGRHQRETFSRMVEEGRPAAFKLSYRIARTLARRLTRLDEEVVEAIRELESRGETDVEAFRDRLITDWSV